ncbi:MAG: translesion DNA synthesis-associated protein ImuA [Gammaproteobacteria bacterium]|nr:translesion DNA synthesis-associated protein ImuA [Gammaproteobacteria bacterium]
MDDGLDRLLRQGQLWRAAQAGIADELPVIATGFADLDARLPGGGWPRGALTELLLEAHGLGELGLLLPALASLCRGSVDEAAEPRWVCWVAPPFMPYAPALAAHGLPPERMLVVHPSQRAQARERAAESLWAAEQALYSGQCCAVLVWAEQVADLRLRRLQLAAEGSDAWAVLVRSAQAREQHSPAALRVHLGGDGLIILKCRGGQPQVPGHSPYPPDRMPAD